MSSSNTPCFYPNGLVESMYQPCAEVEPGNATFCCALSSSVCTYGGYCIGDAGVFYRGGCTDQGWGSKYCPQLCNDVNTDSFANFYPCQAGVFSHDDWVCGDPGQPSTNFCQSSTTFSFDPGRPFMPTFDAPAAPTITVTASPDASSTSTPISNASCPSENFHPAETRVGLGVGLGLGLVLGSLVVTLGYLLARAKRRKVSASEMVEDEHLKPQAGATQPSSGTAGREFFHEADYRAEVYETEGRELK